jgi:guanylate kinase
MIEQGRFVEYARYVGKSYGTPIDFVEQQMAQGKRVLLEIEIQGALQIKAKYPDTQLIFITPPDAKTLVRRLTDRGSETPEAIKGRLTRALAEADGVDQYNDIIINDDLDVCVKEVDEMIACEELHSASPESIRRIQNIQEELRTILKGE